MGEIHFDYKAIGHILKVEMRGPIDELAQQIASHVDTGDVTDARVTVVSYVTDRAAAAISIAHPAGLAIEAKHGALRKAAAVEGLELRAMKHPK